ncbi:M48 family peptidase [Methanosarcinales archaeon]|nr:MAG: M48 family peptidase [Methanosarcinales archaeon]
MKKPVRAFVLAVTILLFLMGCAEVPLTQRKGLHLVPRSQMLALSLQQYDKVLKEAKLSRDRKKTDMVKRVGKRIAGAAEVFLRDSGLEYTIQNYQWEFNLIEDDKMVNAWCMPGGKVAVYTGILPYTRDEIGLAVVMGHEVAHALARHGSERMSQGLLVNMGGIALAVALKEKPASTQRLFMAAFGLGANVGVLLPYSRVHEYEADRIGLTLMARAGYDPRAALPFWERMMKQGGSRPPEFLSTHPATEGRIAKIKEYIPEALPYYEKSRK